MKCVEGFGTAVNYANHLRRLEDELYHIINADDGTLDNYGGEVPINISGWIQEDGSFYLESMWIFEDDGLRDDELAGLEHVEYYEGSRTLKIDEAGLKALVEQTAIDCLKKLDPAKATVIIRNKSEECFKLTDRVESILPDEFRRGEKNLSNDEDLEGYDELLKLRDEDHVVRAELDTIITNVAHLFDLEELKAERKDIKHKLIEGLYSSSKESERLQYRLDEELFYIINSLEDWDWENV